MKRKMFGLDELTRMAGYTDQEITAARKGVRDTAGDDAQDEAIETLRSLQSQAANIARNIEALKTPRPARAKNSAPAVPRKRKCADCKAKLGTDTEKVAGRCAACVAKTETEQQP